MAGENFEGFLSGLRSPERGYYDLAFDYLTFMGTSPLVSDAVKQTIPYEMARTMIDAAAAEADPVRAKSMLATAKSRLEEFVQANPDHRLAATASLELGRVWIEEGRKNLESAARPTRAADKPALTAEARKLFTDAMAIFAEAEKKLEAHFKTFETFIPPEQVERLAEREQTNRDLIDAKRYAAVALFEMSRCYPAGSAEAKDHLQKAADRYEAVNRDYRTLLVGVYARIKQGQCYQAMGEMKRAIGYYTEVFKQPDESPELDPLKTSALLLLLECHVSPSEKEYELAATRGETWLRESRARQTDSPDGVAIRYYTALALKRFAESMLDKDSAKKKQAMDSARDNATLVARLNGPYRDRARQLLTEITGIDPSAKPPTTFADALERGKQAVETAQVEMGAVETDAANRAQHERQAAAALDEGIEYLKLAMRLRTKDTPIDEVNQSRYMLAFAHYLAGNYYDAAVLGEFLISNYPASAAARPGAKLALAGYLASYNAAPIDQRGFDRERMTRVAETIAETWSGEPEADEAWLVLLDLARLDHDRARLLEYLSKIGDDSPRRGEAELKIGSALWNEYLRAMRLEEGERPPAAELENLSKTARETLARGVERSKAALAAGGDVSPSAVTAALSLAQIEVSSGAAPRALEVLQDKQVGPLALVEAKSPLVGSQTADFAKETYKVALRAFVGTQSLDQAERMMDELEKLVAAGGDSSSAELTKIYISLGLELQEELELLREQNRADELANVSRGFELFLDRIAARQQGNNFSSLNWVAATLSNLAAGNDNGDAKLPPQAVSYYKKALAADERILAAAQADPNFASGDVLLAIELRMAKCERRLGQFKEALDRLERILRKKPMLLEPQREAALAFQDWGAENPLYYSLAIRGGRAANDDRGQKVNTIWGWAKLSNMVYSNPDYADAFYEARYNLATCRYLQSITQSGESKAKGLADALSEINYMIRTRPTLGGESWRAKYDELLKKIQQAAGQPVTGLPTT